MKTSDIQVKLIDHMGTDLSVVNAARVSFDKESDWDTVLVNTLRDEEDGSTIQYYDVALRDGDAKLITYLAKHKHFSPFNHAFLTFRVKAPIFVARQLVKHKFMPWNEVSRRYVDSEPEFFMPDNYRAKAENVKQGSAESLFVDVDPFDVQTEYGPMVQTHPSLVELCLDHYKHLLKSDVCPEQSRMVLPLNTMTEWMWSGTLGAFADMLKLRLDPHTQYESRIVAQLIHKEVEKLFPVSIKALLENK